VPYNVNSIVGVCYLADGVAFCIGTPLGTEVSDFIDDVYDSLFQDVTSPSGPSEVFSISGFSSSHLPSGNPSLRNFCDIFLIVKVRSTRQANYLKGGSGIVGLGLYG
jgi:hypothetical protein